LKLDIDWLLDQKPDLIQLPGKIVGGKFITFAPAMALIWENKRFESDYYGPIYERDGSLIFARK
jgi:hypothetical protein